MDCTRLPIAVTMFALKFKKNENNIIEPPPPNTKIIITISIIKQNKNIIFETFL